MAVPARHENAQHERDGDDDERSCELHDGGLIERVGAGVHPVPRGSGGRDG